MYNEQLEQLIDAALADGVLTEKEKQILFKKAQTFGIDLDEFEMVLDARLVKIQKEQQAAPKSNKLGDVKKCPACGAIVQSYQGKCNECGYEFENIQANLSSVKLAEELKRIDDEYNVKIESLLGDKNRDKRLTLETKMRNRKEQVILTFPIPITKADLVEFITIMGTQAVGGGSLSEAYMGKYEECVVKSKILFPKDKQLESAIEDIENKRKEKEKVKVKSNREDNIENILMLLYSLVVIFLFCVAPWYIPKKITAKQGSKIEALYNNENAEAAIEKYASLKSKHKRRLSDKALMILSDCIDKNDIKNAEDVFLASEAKLYENTRVGFLNIFSNKDYKSNSNKMAQLLYSYYMENENYDKARIIVSNAEGKKYDFWGMHIRDVVVALCEDGKISEAERYLKQYAWEINKKDKEKTAFVKEMEAVIRSY